MSDRNADEKNAMLQGEIDNLNQKVAFLEAKLKELESNKDIPKGPWDVVGPGLVRKTSCTKCGLTLKGTMGYVCTDKDCPTFYVPWC